MVGKDDSSPHLGPVEPDPLLEPPPITLSSPGNSSTAYQQRIFLLKTQTSHMKPFTVSDLYDSNALLHIHI